MEKNVHICIEIALIEEKAGLSPDDTFRLVKYIREQCPHLEFSGLMTIGSAAASHSAAEQHKNPDFEVYVSLLAFIN